MSGSTFGTRFRITTWGESHGAGVGVVVDGCPAGLPLCEADIQKFLDRRKPGQSKYTTARNESDQVEILSGIFEGVTCGTPISLMVKNTDQRSRDYGNLAYSYRPGHADYTFDSKYGVRDYRGGGRSSGRETIGRVAAGAIAMKILKELHIDVMAYTKAIGSIVISEDDYDFSKLNENPFYMPNESAASRAEVFLNDCKAHENSSGGIIECRVLGMPAGIGETVFDKLDANLGKAMLSIGAVKGVEFGDGFGAATSLGSENNDAFFADERGIHKSTNHAGGILGGMSDGSPIILRAAIKPTPSISQKQHTVTKDGTSVEMEIHGRHDPVIVPRAVVVVEAMTALTILDLLFSNMGARMEGLKNYYKENNDAE